MQVEERMRSAFDRIPSQVPCQGHQLDPKLAKLALNYLGGVFNLRPVHRAEPVVGSRARGGIVVHRLGGIQPSGEAICTARGCGV